MRAHRSSLVVLALVAALLAAAPATARDEPVVAVLDAPGMTAVGTPSGLTPAAIASALSSQGLAAATVDPGNVPAGVDVLVNPYGEAFPATASVQAALDGGAGWVNLAGTPFLRPNGSDDGRSPARYGVFGVSVPTSVPVASQRSELGAALVDSMPASVPVASGVTVHAADPDDERPLASYVDSEGLDAGPSVTLVTKPYRVVAVGVVGPDSPVSPTRPEFGAVLADLVAAAGDDEPGITGLSVTRDGGVLHVAASGDGVLQGVGDQPAPARWSPTNPSEQWVTVKLVRHGKLVDVRRVPANAAEVKVVGSRITLNGAPYVPKGIGPSAGYAPGTTAAQRVAIKRQDYAAMHAMGADSIRSWGVLSDWEINLAARNGLTVIDSLPLGWETQLTDDRVADLEPWARFIGGRSTARHNVFLLSMGNEEMDLDDSNFAPRLERLVKAAKAGAKGRTPVTYVAFEGQVVTNGPWPFLDVYSFNNYGTSWAFSTPDPGFDGLMDLALSTRTQGRPLLVTEFGVDGLVSNATCLLSLCPVSDVVDQANALELGRKWDAMKARGVGGYAFAWADDPEKKDFVVPYWRELLGSVEYPPGSGHSPLNPEEYWGLLRVDRTPRASYWALRQRYLAP